MVFSELIPCDGIASSYLKQTSEYPVVVFWFITTKNLLHRRSVISTSAMQK
jgi:hypothetical protein